MRLLKLLLNYVFGEEPFEQVDCLVGFENLFGWGSVRVIRYLMEASSFSSLGVFHVIEHEHIAPLQFLASNDTSCKEDLEDLILSLWQETVKLITFWNCHGFDHSPSLLAVPDKDHVFELVLRFVFLFFLLGLRLLSPLWEQERIQLMVLEEVIPFIARKGIRETSWREILCGLN